MLFDIKKERQDIEHEYIGFSPNTTNVKPVHLANGMFRNLLGEAYETQRLFQFVFSAKSDGEIPNGHRVEQVFQWLRDEDRISEGDVSQESASAFRSTLLKIVSADKPSAVSTSGMESYSAGFAAFVSNDRVAQDAGEFLGLWFSRQAPAFSQLIADSIADASDPITILAEPLFGRAKPAKMQLENPENIRCFQEGCPPAVSLGMQKLAATAERVAPQLSQHPNKLVRLRMIVLFSAFLVVRYLADLEHLYTGKSFRRPAFLLDVLPGDRSEMRLASQHSYILACQSITRFYAWMFADYLRTQQPDPERLASDFPVYSRPTRKAFGKSKDKDDQSIFAEVWQEAASRAATEAEPYLIYGQAVYDILALFSASPVQYLTSIGIRCGLFWPPHNFQPTKHLALRQDLLEVLVRSVVNPGEVLDLQTLETRLWEAFGILVGGRPDDANLLLERGIYQADDRALADNQAAFAQKLSDLNFARLLADGVLEIQVG